MKAMSKQQVKEKGRLAESVRAAQSELSEVIERANETMRREWSAVEQATARLNDELLGARDWAEQVQADAQSYYDDSEATWQASEAGQDFLGWVESLTLQAEEVVLNEPAEIESIEDDLGDAVEAIPEEVGM